MSKLHFICVYSGSPELTQRPELKKTSSGLPLILHYGELYNYLLIHPNVIIIEIKCTTHVMCLNHPETTPHTGTYVPTPHPLHGKIVFHETRPWGWLVTQRKSNPNNPVNLLNVSTLLLFGQHHSGPIGYCFFLVDQIYLLVSSTIS